MDNYNQDASNSQANKSAKESTKRNTKNYNEEFATEFSIGSKEELAKPEMFVVNKEQMAKNKKKNQE